jgi:arginine:pyruvate transaminase
MPRPASARAGWRAPATLSSADLVHGLLHGNILRVHRPDAGMFALVDVRATGLSGDEFAGRLLDEEHLAVMPGESFGETLAGWLRVSLTKSDDEVEEACRRMMRFAARVTEGKAA